MNWSEVLELEPKLAEVEKWARTIDDPADEFFEKHYLELKRRLNPIVGWNREIPDFERVPYAKNPANLGEMHQHDIDTGNTHRKRVFLRVPIHLRVLYTSEAWDAALQHLLEII